MKKTLKTLVLVTAVALLMPSCVNQTFMITDNPVGNKKGVAKLRFFAKDASFSLEDAAKKGGITKISIVETRTTFFIFPFVKTTVWGE